MQQILIMIGVMFLVTVLFWLGQLIPKRTLSESNYKYRSRQMAFITNILLLLIFILYFALREIDGKVGGLDAIVYKNRFLGATGNFWTAISSQDNEIGYALFVVVVRYFTANFKIFLIIYYGILLLLANNINKHIKRSAISFPLTWIFITLNIFLSICLMRNQLSCFLAFNSLLYFSKKKYKSSFAYLLCAVSCHISAIILIFCYLLYYCYHKRNWSLLKLIFCIIFLCITFLMGGALLKNILKNTKYIIYFSGDKQGDVGYGQLLRFILVFVIYLYIKPIQKRTDRIDLHLMMILSIFAVFPLQIYISVIYRMFCMGAYSQTILLNESYLSYSKRYRKNKIFLFAIALLVLAVELILFIKSSVPSYGLLPIIFNSF